MALAYKVNGLAGLQKKLAGLSKQVKQDAIEAIEDAADSVVIKASNAAPVDLGVLKQSIANEPKNGGLNYIVFVGAEYAPYVEFGTGAEVNVPSELSSYAKQYKGTNGKSVNIPAQPFFFPAYFEERKKLLEVLNDKLRKAVR